MRATAAGPDARPQLDAAWKRRIEIRLARGVSGRASDEGMPGIPRPATCNPSSHLAKLSRRYSTRARPPAGVAESAPFCLLNSGRSRACRASAARIRLRRVELMVDKIIRSSWKISTTGWMFEFSIAPCSQCRTVFAVCVSRWRAAFLDERAVVSNRRCSTDGSGMPLTVGGECGCHHAVWMETHLHRIAGVPDAAASSSEKWPLQRGPSARRNRPVH